MTTAGERLRQLAGFSGTAAALLLAIGQGATASAALVDYSGLPTGSAAEHLLAEHAVPPAPTFEISTTGGAGVAGGEWRAVRPRYLRDDALVWMGVR